MWAHWYKVLWIETPFSKEEKKKKKKRKRKGKESIQETKNGTTTGIGHDHYDRLSEDYPESEKSTVSIICVAVPLTSIYVCRLILRR